MRKRGCRTARSTRQSALGGYREHSPAPGCGCWKTTDLATPAHSQTPPFLDSRVRLPQFLHQIGHLLGRLRRVGGSGEEIAHLLLLLVGIRWEDGLGKRLAVEEIGHEDLILMALVRMGEDVGALEGLRAIAEDVVDDEDGGSCARWTGRV